MPTSYRQIFYHIVFRTDNSEQTLALEHSDELYRYIWGIVKNQKTRLYRINGMQEHVHMFTDLHPTIALAVFIQKIKTASSIWLKQNPNFPRFRGWADGYAALTTSWKEKDKIINYIMNQREHHKKASFMDEYRALLEEAGMKIEERFFPQLFTVLFSSCRAGIVVVSPPVPRYALHRRLLTLLSLRDIGTPPAPLSMRAR